MKGNILKACQLTSDMLTLDPRVSVAEFGPRDADPLPAGRAHVWGEGHAAVVLHALELVLLGRLHVHNGVLVHVLLQDHSLFGCTVAGHLNPLLLLVDENGYDEKDDYSQEKTCQNPGC